MRSTSDKVKLNFFLIASKYFYSYVLILLLFSITRSYLLTDMEYLSTTLDQYNIMEYTSTTLEEYGIIYPDATFDYITKHDYDGVQITFSQENFQNNCK